MRILIIRHGDPNYLGDTLTPKGWKEAEMLAERLAKEKIDAFYVSPLGRAQDTASCTLKKMNRTATTKEWMREFPQRIHRPDRSLVRSCAWDWLPADWTQYPCLLDPHHWGDHPVYQEAHVKEKYDEICAQFDLLLSSHGYVRDGYFYRTEQGNHDTIVLFCHFGLECVLLSHLMNISPVPLWHGAVAAPSSVTEIHTEERRKGEVYFRMSEFGSTAHLYVHDEPPAFAARYAECFEDKQKH